MKIDIGSKQINIRGWKGKDKKAFLNALKVEKIDENNVMDTLVYSCIEEDIILSTDEFKYVLSRIRAISLGEEINIEFYCTKCGELYKKDFLLKDIIRWSYNNLKEIKVQDIIIKLGEIKNKTIYIQKIAEDELYDLLLRIESFNGDTSFTLDELIDKFDNLDLSIISNIIEQYENAKFKLLNINTVECPKCKNKTDFEFDELPGFFPQSWFE
jgi:hypothetical protein